MKPSTRRLFLFLSPQCVVCLAAPACMQTFPCGHKVICRKCLIKTIQVAVSQRCLPLRCVICRNRILRLQHTSATSGTSSASTTSAALHHHGHHHHHHHQQHQKHQQQGVCLQENNSDAMCNIPSPSLLLSPSSSPSPPSIYSPASSIATAGALTLTPIVIRSLTGSGQDGMCSPISAMISPGTCHETHAGGQSRPLSPLAITSASVRAGAYCIEPQHKPSILRDSCFAQEMVAEDDPWRRASPSPPPATDMEAFVFSHNDALNLHRTKPSPPPPNRVEPNCHNHSGSSHQTAAIPRGSSTTRTARSCFSAKQDGSYKTSSTTNSTSSTSTSNSSTISGVRQGGRKTSGSIFSPKPAAVSSPATLGFMPGQSIKVHPETLSQPHGFMMPSQPSTQESHSSASPSRFPKSNISASKFIAKFLPKSSRRRYNWLRHE